MTLASVFVAFFVAHHVGDYLLQTEWQAVNKTGGLARGATVARRALLAHVTLYTAAFIPVLVWVATESSAAAAAGLAALIFVPHLIIDDGRLLQQYLVHAKHVTLPASPALGAAVDQSLHVLSLFVVALLAVAVT